MQAIIDDFSAAADAAVGRAEANVVRWVLRQRMRDQLMYRASFMEGPPTHWCGIPLQEVTIDDLF